MGNRLKLGLMNKVMSKRHCRSVKAHPLWSPLVCHAEQPSIIDNTRTSNLHSQACYMRGTRALGILGCVSRQIHSWLFLKHTRNVRGASRRWGGGGVVNFSISFGGREIPSRTLLLLHSQYLPQVEGTSLHACSSINYRMMDSHPFDCFILMLN